jgi:hypothetical protein
MKPDFIRGYKMEDYKNLMKQINRNRNLALSFGFIPALLFPVAFNLIVNGGEIVALLVGLFYVITGFLSLYFANK